TMRERIARAIDPTYWASFDAYCIAKEWSPAEIAEERARSKGVRASIARADAVLAAMGEPTIPMQNAGWREIDKQGFEAKDTEVAPIYRAMLAAAGEPE